VSTRAVTLLVAAVLLAAPAARGVRGGQPPLDETALLTEIGFSAHEIAKIARGETVARTTQADSSAVALAVASTIAAPMAFYLERFRDIEVFKKAPEIVQIGRFSRDPSASEMTACTLEQSDVNDLKSCRPGDCGVKLDESGIQSIAGRDARLETASAAMRQYLAAYTQKYLRSGNAALIAYYDASKPRRLADDLRLILERSPYLQRGWPALFDAVGNFAGTLPAGLDGFVYWSKEKIGPRAVVSITHAIISPPRDGNAAIATKQIYASHYGHASLGLTILLDRSSVNAPATRVIYVNRSRLDIFGGIFGSIKRPLVRSRARDGSERTMNRLREHVESAYRTKH
jgi:hypothetical protein